MGGDSCLFSAAFLRKTINTLHICLTLKIENKIIKTICQILFLHTVYGYHSFIVLNTYVEIAKSDRRVFIKFNNF